MLFRLSGSLLSLLLVVGLLTGCSFSKEAQVASVTLTDQVDATTKAPRNARTSFAPGTKSVYASVRVLNPGKGTKVEARWFYDKQGKGEYNLIDRAEIIFDRSSRERYAAMVLTARNTFPPGPYRIEVYLDGKLAVEQSFTVQ